MSRAEVDIKRLCELSLLELEPSQEERLHSQLADIIALVEQLPEKVEDRDMLSTMSRMQLRKDEVTPSLSRDELLSVAPKTEAGCIIVPNMQN